MLEGVRRAGKQPTREKLRDTPETLHRFHIGDVERSFSPTSHTGLDYTGLPTVGMDGRFRR